MSGSQDGSGGSTLSGGADPRAHWQKVYQTTRVTEVSWYQPVPERSLALIRAAGISRSAPILDVGGGASTLVDHLLREGYQDVTVLDLATSALGVAQERLGDIAARAHWISGDITEFRPARQYALWHDRAVFHFLTEPARRRRYLDVLHLALAAGGHLILAGFGPKGPTHCSGLEVERYSVEQLEQLLGPEFQLMRSEVEDHITPVALRQQFLYGWWKRRI